MWLLVMTAMTLLAKVEARPILDCRVDVMFVLDGSASVGARNWWHILNFMRDFADFTDYGPKKLLCGVVSFGDTATLDMKLADHRTAKDFTGILWSIDYKDEGTNTAAGLRLAREHLFNPAQGSRPDAYKMMIVVTDGQPTVDTLQTLPEIAMTSEAGVTIFAVGIGRDLRRAELLQLVDGNTDLVFSVDDIEDIVRSVGHVLGDSCKMVTSIPVSPRFNITTQPPQSRITLDSRESFTPTVASNATLTPGDTLSPVSKGISRPAPEKGATPVPGGNTTQAPGGSGTQSKVGSGTQPQVGSDTQPLPKMGSGAPGSSSTPAPGSSDTPAPGGGGSGTPAPGSSGLAVSGDGGTLAPGISGSPASRGRGTPGGTATSAPGSSGTKAQVGNATPVPGDSGAPGPGGNGTAAPGGSGTLRPGGSGIPGPGDGSTLGQGGSGIPGGNGTLGQGGSGAVQPDTSGIPRPGGSRIPGGSRTGGPGSSRIPGGSSLPQLGGTRTPGPGGNGTSGPSDSGTPGTGGSDAPGTDESGTPGTGGNGTRGTGSSQTPGRGGRRIPSSVSGGTTLVPGGALPGVPCEYTDLVLLLDSSGSLKKEGNWAHIKEVATIIFTSLVLGTENTQIGIVTFSSEAFLTVQLGSITDRHQLTATIASVRWISQMTNISGALSTARTRMFNTKHDRKDAPNVVLLITDGLTNRAIGTTRIEANKLKNAGVDIFVVGIGEKVDLQELRTVSSEPIRHYMMLVPDVDELTEHAEAIFRRTCVDLRPVMLAHDDVDGTCPFDVVAVMHDTEGSPESFKLMIDIIRNLTSTVDLSTHRIGMIAQSSQKAIRFYPTEYIWEDDFLEHLDRLSYIGPSTDVSSTFRQGLDMLHQAEDKDAAPVLKILMLLLPAGVDPSDLRALEDDARAARAAGVIVYVVYNNMPREELVRVPDEPVQLFLLPFAFPIITTDICLTHQSDALGCDFETPEGTPTLCTMTQGTADQFNWTLQTGDTPSRHTGPKTAVTGTYYAFMEASAPRLPGDTAELFLPRVTWSGPSCLSFFYHMRGWHVGMLQVVVKSPGKDEQVMWVLGGDQAKKWLMGMVTVAISGNDQVFFRAVRGGTYPGDFSGDISLDHVRLSSSPCLTTTGDTKGLILT